jgi:lipopolysaccharide transport system permease protein
MALPASRPHVKIRPSRGWSALNLGEVWEFRDVLAMLMLRDIKLRYKQTALGVIWVLLQPLLAGIVMSIVFGYFAKMPSDGQPYLLFVFAGLLGWNLFAGVLQRAGNSLVVEARLITKVYFPRLLIPIASALAGLLDFVVSLSLMLALMAWYRVWPGRWLALLPVMVLLNLTLALGVSFWLSALNVRYRDFMYALPFFIQVWMYGSPVVYGLGIILPEWRGWFALNPMTGVLEGFRQALLGTSSLTPFTVEITVLLSLAALVSGAYFFRRVEREFADRL